MRRSVPLRVQGCSYLHLSDLKKLQLSTSLNTEAMESDVRLAKRCHVMEDEVESYDVFISHRGPDTKTGFVGFLYNYLKDVGLRPFLDCKSILKGQDAWTYIEHAIKMTPIALVIFSENFAQSQWCLDELHVMLDTPGIKVLPIFYKVQPFEVGFPERGPFAVAFEKLEQRHNEIVIKQWREDLRRASKLNGWECRVTDHSLEEDLVKAIVKEVLELANKPLPLDVGEHVFGVNKVAQGIIQKLDDNKKVRVLGLWGMGGIGKSTLAKELYNLLSKRFGAACYIEDVKEKVDQSEGTTKVQNCILNDLGLKDVKIITNKSNGKVIMEERLCKKRILLVLDDICTNGKMSFLVSRKMLGEGSLCIVTSRNMRVFDAFMDYEVHTHDVQRLGSLDSIQVVASCAFGDHLKVKEGFKVLVENISKACGGIPLVLKVCGALLKSEEDVDVWRDVLKKLESGTMIGHMDIFKCLWISYDALEKEYQEMFLDITCALRGKSRALAMRAWYAHGWDGALGIRTLVEKALVIVDKNGCLCMHDQLRDMGREIVRRRRENDGVIRRLWMPESSLFLEGDVDGSLESLETLVVFSRPSSLNNDLDISRMKKLRILMCDDSSKVMSSIPESLCWWDWHGPWFCGLQMKRIFPEVLPMNKLVFLNLQRFGVTMLPESFGGLSKLEVLNLTACEKLLFLPHSIRRLQNVKDFSYWGSGFFRLLHLVDELDNFETLSVPAKFLKLSNFFEFLSTQKKFEVKNSGFANEVLPELFGCLSNLEVLSLAECTNLELLPSSFRGLRKLQDLNLEHSGVGSLPEFFGDLCNLEVLSLARCTKLKLLPSSFGGLKKLKDLNLEHFGVESLPEFFGDLCNLEVLSLARCTKLKLLPSSFGGLKKLKDLNLQNFGVESLPEFFGDLCNLEVLNLAYCSDLVLLPESFCNLGKLRVLKLRRSGISSLPDSFRDLCNLEVLSLAWCTKLKLLPSSFGGLKKLKDLNLEYSGVGSLPEFFGDLCNLEVLSLAWCTKLKLLPSSFGGLKKLKDLNLEHSGVGSLPEFFGDLCNLEVLSLAWCTKLKLLPSSFEGLKKLKDLNLEYSGVGSLPEFFGDLCNLEVLNLTYCSDLVLLPESFCNLGKLRVLELKRSGISSLPDSFRDLSNLEILCLARCKNLELLPMSFGGLRKLRHLSMVASAISSLPKSFGGLSSLHELDLSSCQSLEALPQSFTQLSNLLELNLGDCPARNSFISLEHLMRPDLEVNTEHQDRFDDFREIFVLDLIPGFEDG